MMVLGLDADHADSANWNPLGELVRPGQKVLIKPNLVNHTHLGGGEYDAVVTHGSLIRCILDYVGLALKGHGAIIVGDAPVQSADFSKTVERTGLAQLCEHASKVWRVPVSLRDFRLSSVELNSQSHIIKRRVMKGDEGGYRVIDLGKKSLLAPIGHYADRFRVTNYNCYEMRLHHNSHVNEYLVPKSVLEADVFINLPKLKTHRKVGITAALKNVVGINGHKDWLPHHRYGALSEGGDEYREPSFLKRFVTHFVESIDENPRGILNSCRRLAIRVADRLIYHTSADPFSEGSWYGNDTIWRTVLDLNRLLVYADKEGMMQETPQRRCFTIVDAVVAGDGEGPLEPNARPLGLLAGATNSVALDTILSALIGFDYRKIPLIANAYRVEDWPLIDFSSDAIEVHFQGRNWSLRSIEENNQSGHFRPASGWVGHIEIHDPPSINSL
jgi:uncharacterized protein (DUF362 family)